MAGLLCRCQASCSGDGRRRGNQRSAESRERTDPWLALGKCSDTAEMDRAGPRRLSSAGPPRGRCSPRDLGLATGAATVVRPGTATRGGGRGAGVHVDRLLTRRLEQRRGSRPSQADRRPRDRSRVCDSRPDERDHLFRLAGHVAPPRGYRSDHVSPAPGTRARHASTRPPQVVLRARRGAQAETRSAEALLGVQTGYSGPGAQASSTAGSPITRSGAASRRQTHEFPLAPAYAASLAARPTAAAPTTAKAVALGRPAPPREAAKFAELWERHEVAVRSDTRKRILHPVIGLNHARLSGS